MKYVTTSLVLHQWRTVFWSALATSVVATGPARSHAATPSPNRPLNIVFILADDLGWNQVGFHGFDWYQTTNIDRIARDGMYFRHAYSAASICSPTRAALMTGKYPARLHLTDYIPGNPHEDEPLVTPQQVPCLPLEETTIPEMLRPMGYISGHFGKWHLSTDYNYEPGRIFDPASQGFDVVYTARKPESDLDPAPPDAHSAVEINRRAIEFIEANQDRPFFCYVSHNVVHRPLYEEEAMIEKYRTKPGSEDPTHNPVMAAMIERMDTGIGEILDTLDRLHLTDNTVVFFYSDNGGLASLQSQAPWRAGKSTLYEGGIRVPLAVRWPGVIEPGRRSDEPVITQDLFCTIMEIARVQYRTDYHDGVSLVPVLSDATSKLNRDALYWHYPHYHHQGGRPGTAIREGPYKLIEWYEGTLLGLGPSLELFDIVRDPGEQHNLADSMPQLAQRLQEKIQSWRTEVSAQEMSIRN